jgi:SAM-dependent methyltransferase
VNAIHPVAARGFGSDAERYERGRPGYPSGAVDWLLEHAGLRSAAVVADIGAGTGKLTRMLGADDRTVVAVEPVAEMARLAATHAPFAHVVLASAERTPFADASIDAITVAQAFHWFDGPRAWTEFARVLKRGGTVGLIWNARLRSIPWVDQVWTIMDGVEKQAPWRDHDDPRDIAFGQHAAGFSVVAERSFEHDIPVTRQDMLDRVASVSHVAVLAESDRGEVLRQVDDCIPTDEGLAVRYRADVYALQRT